MRWRAFFIDGPARFMDRAFLWYCAILAAVTILCFVNVGLELLAYWWGIPLP
jgi:hypothetical protein